MIKILIDVNSFYWRLSFEPHCLALSEVSLFISVFLQILFNFGYHSFDFTSLLFSFLFLFNYCYDSSLPLFLFASSSLLSNYLLTVSFLPFPISSSPIFCSLYFLFFLQCFPCFYVFLPFPVHNSPAFIIQKKKQ